MQAQSGQQQRASSTMSLSKKIAPRRSNTLGIIILILGIAIATGAGIYGYIESRRVESVVIAARDITYGRQIVPDDLMMIDVPYYRPLPLQGIVDPSLVIGKYATRAILKDDLINASMVSETPPDVPVYPNGKRLERNMVAVPFSLANVGPISDSDFLNIGIISPDPALCDRVRADVALGTVLPPPPPLVLEETLRPYACRMMSKVEILYIEGDVAYLHLTPAQALALRAIQASNASVWAERYGASSDPLQYMDRMDGSQITLPELTRPVTETLRIEPQRLPSYAPAIGQPVPTTVPDAEESESSGSSEVSPTVTPTPTQSP